MSQEDIDRAVKDAEMHAEEDRKQKEAVEIRNRAETTVFQSKKAMEDAGDKLTDGDKAPVQTAITKLEETLKSGTTEAIKADTEALEKALYELSSKLYQQPGAQGDQGGNSGAGGDDTVYDADFTDKTN